MRKYKLLFFFFGVWVILQWIIPLSTIWEWQDIRDTGKIFKFKIIDTILEERLLTVGSGQERIPYLIIPYAERSFQIDGQDSIWDYNQKVYVFIEEDTTGFAKILDVKKELNASDKNLDFIKAEIDGVDYGQKDSITEITLYIQYPFYKYLMGSEVQAEVFLRKIKIQVQLDTLSSYAQIRVKDGKAVIQDISLFGLSLFKD